MKKIALALIFTLLLTIAAPLTSSADSGKAPDGFYKLTGTTKFVPVSSFISGKLKYKVSILTDTDYYLILNGNAILAYDIIFSSSDAELEKNMITETELKRMFNVGIDSNGKVIPGGFVDDEGFRAEEIF